MRILAGLYKGRNLLSPPEHGPTRPITAAVKKSLLDTLGPQDGAVVADLYCGSGTLGLEAMSRGAARCYFADRDRAALKLLSENIQSLGLSEACIIWGGDVTAGLRQRLAQIGSPLDLAFVDPPYVSVEQWSWPQAVETIFDPLAQALAPEGIVVLRVSGRVQVPRPLGGLALLRERDYGDMKLLYWTKSGESR